MRFLLPFLGEKPKNIFRPLESHINQYDRYAWKNVCFPMSIFGPCFPIRTILGRINLLRK